jgi:hypothetical protein
MAIRSKSSSSRNVESLRLTIDCLPVSTREAMLAGVRDAPRIIVGAYTDAEGGVCPMLAAHRRGGRTSFLSFARAWDRFTRAGRSARTATRRERSILIGQLEASLAEEAGLGLDQAIAEHRRARQSREREERDPRGEILVRRGLARLRRRPRYSASPGRMNIISGTTQAGEVLSR